MRRPCRTRCDRAFCLVTDYLTFAVDELVLATEAYPALVAVTRTVMRLPFCLLDSFTEFLSEPNFTPLANQVYERVTPVSYEAG